MRITKVLAVCTALLLLLVYMYLVTALLAQGPQEGRSVAMYIWISVPPRVPGPLARIEVATVLGNSTLFHELLNRSRISPAILVKVYGGTVVATYGAAYPGPNGTGVIAMPGASATIVVRASGPIIVVDMVPELGNFSPYTAVYIDGSPSSLPAERAILVESKKMNLVAECVETASGGLIAVQSPPPGCSVSATYMRSPEPVRLVETKNGVSLYRAPECPTGLRIVCPGASIAVPSITYKLFAIAGTVNRTLAIAASSPLKVERARLIVEAWGGGNSTQIVVDVTKNMTALVELPRWATNVSATLSVVASTEGTILLSKVLSSVVMAWSWRSSLRAPSAPRLSLTNAVGRALLLVGLASCLALSMWRSATSAHMGGAGFLREFGKDVAAYMAAWVVLFTVWRYVLAAGLGSAIAFIGWSRSIDAAIQVICGEIGALISTAIAAALWGSVALFAVGMGALVLSSLPFLAPVSVLIAETSSIAINRLADFLTYLGNYVAARAEIASSIASPIIAASVAEAIARVVAVTFPIASAALMAAAAFRPLTRKCIAASLGFAAAPVMMKVVGIPFATAVIGPPISFLESVMKVMRVVLGGYQTGVIASVIGGVLNPDSAGSAVGAAIVRLVDLASVPGYAATILVAAELLSIGTAFILAGLVYWLVPTLTEYLASAARSVLARLGLKL